MLAMGRPMEKELILVLWKMRSGCAMMGGMPWRSSLQSFNAFTPTCL
jgi:hypothetical protein